MEPTLSKSDKKAEVIYKEESYRIIGCCFEVHKTLGKGFSEIVYKDAQEAFCVMSIMPILLYLGT